uniref:Uncharacterized protein n=1 Tax=Nelumbo nucifera TaxID=4432 RepID=A0A822YXF3_NELNU|nr:TPA_asm: hypothetical protein HUJ06_012769 [Nelumbo nucifera]
MPLFYDKPRYLASSPILSPQTLRWVGYVFLFVNNILDRKQEVMPLTQGSYFLLFLVICVDFVKGFLSSPESYSSGLIEVLAFGFAYVTHLDFNSLLYFSSEFEETTDFTLFLP